MRSVKGVSAVKISKVLTQREYKEAMFTLYLLNTDCPKNRRGFRSSIKEGKPDTKDVRFNFYLVDKVYTNRLSKKIDVAFYLL